MNTTPTPASRPSLFRGILACACVVAFPLLSVSAAAADDSPPQSRADAPALPVSHSFEKVESANGTPFVLKVKNDSKVTLKLSGRVLLSVVNHAMDKARKLPEHSLEAGKTWEITELTADDKVVLSATGYAPLEIRVPFKL
jgi:hypothetical protein